MERDRKEICQIISEMLDHPDKNGIYPTTKAYEKLEKYMEEDRKALKVLTICLTVGWVYGDLHKLLDQGIDIRKINLVDVKERALKAFE